MAEQNNKTGKRLAWSVLINIILVIFLALALLSVAAYKQAANSTCYLYNNLVNVTNEESKIIEGYSGIDLPEVLTLKCMG